MISILFKNKVVKNASWIICCKVVQSILSLLIGLITARYLGPQNYGVLNYAASLVAFLFPVMQLGLNSTLVQELIVTPQEEGKIIGTSLVCCVVSAFFSILSIILFSMVVNHGDLEAIIICGLYSLTLLFQAIEVIQYWFQAHYLSKFPSIASILAYTLSSIYKIFLLITNKSIKWFAITHVLEALIIASVLMFFYFKYCKQTLEFSLQTVKRLLNNSKFYIVSGIMVTIYQQTDKVMLKLLYNDAETGFYSSAVTCVGIFAFLFTAIIDSSRPLILESKRISKQEYDKKLEYLFSIVTFLSLVQSIVLTLFSEPIILILFGSDFISAAPVLQIVVWYSTFGYYGVVRNIWILGENKQHWLLTINIIGAVVNITLNSFLIPIIGAIGAAIASLVTQIFSNFILGFIIKDISYINKLIIKSWNPTNIFYLIDDLKKAKY